MVRAHNFATAQMAQRIDSETTELVYLLQVDLKGWLPASAIRLAMANKVAKIFSDLRALLEPPNVPQLEPFYDAEIQLPNALVPFPGMFNKAKVA